MRNRPAPDVIFGAEIEGIGWLRYAWMEAGLPTCVWNCVTDIGQTGGHRWCCVSGSRDGVRLGARW